MRIQVLSILILAFGLFFDGNNLGYTNTSAATAFVKKVKGTGRLIDVIQTHDGNYLSISSGRDSGGSFEIRKDSASARTIWERSITFSLSDEWDYAYVSGIAETNDGYIVVGTGNFGGYYSPASGIVMKLKSNGTVKWSQRFENGGSLSFNSVSTTPDGGFMITGAIYPGIFHPIVARFTSEGNVLWAKQFESLSYQFSSVSLSDNSVILASDIFTDENQTHLKAVNLVKVDDSGNVRWNRILTTNSSAILGASRDRGFVVATHPPKSSNLILMHFDEGGRVQWKDKYNLHFSDFSVSKLSQTEDGGHLVTGASYDKNGETANGFLLKIDSKRNPIQMRSFGQIRKSSEGRGAFQTNEGAYFVFGQAWGGNPLIDMLFIKSNSEGFVSCNFLQSSTARKLLTPKISIADFPLNAEVLTLPTPISIQLTSKATRNEVSTSCQE
jgi:hypothetical protein